jgi:hypothetical protein
MNVLLYVVTIPIEQSNLKKFEYCFFLNMKML